MSEAPTEYSAQDEYLRETRAAMRPRNYSPRVAHRFRDSISTAMKNDPSLIAELQPGYTQRVREWSAKTKDERLAEVSQIRNHDELRAAMIVEEDPDVLYVMVDRLAEMKGLQPRER